MLTALSSLLMAMSGTTAAQPQPQQPPPGVSQTVVVVGDRLADLRRRLAACLARRCPTNEDIDATTALAELLFDTGDYRGARSALLGSIGRNRRHAEQYPEPVSELYRANAMVARHLGFDADARFSTWEILHSLQRGIPVEDARHFTARLEVIESLIAFGEYVQARDQLRALRAARAPPDATTSSRRRSCARSGSITFRTRMATRSFGSSPPCPPRRTATVRSAPGCCSFESTMRGGKPGRPMP